MVKGLPKICFGYLEVVLHKFYGYLGEEYPWLYRGTRYVELL